MNSTLKQIERTKKILKNKKPQTVDELIARCNQLWKKETDAYFNQREPEIEESLQTWAAWNNCRLT